MKNIIILSLAFFLTSACILPSDNSTNILNTNIQLPTENREAEVADIPVTVEDRAVIEPIAEFSERITKKPFGIYITRETSPVQPEKFTGYHTGVDVEYGDKPEEEIKVLAIADGVVVRSGWVSGYGGMLAIRHSIDKEEYVVIYGHLAPNSLPELNQKVSQGDTVGVLGDAYSNETAGERKHLHLAIYTGTDINVRGYVSKQSDLVKWLDPLEFFTQAD
ncbi:MAG: hypothetical protein A2406_04330 [Candidatus Komeilibacteria bacterium RIFOXYC1_FULL_37_11]|uniref:M23ase beta-sheet core domain-containing protein n=1 Tax=Candidatus Komeilibacteria bacterium RIFOXYC1_FULL_37_11 TaxID=1798555 RepID=A0A1G2BZC1_9BACT|nr:MAG: hypothetical protein A2406_04330 [Candidatus Komeilibacteria bacterium RIFOXYC1_FULL_37_11]OGY95429.1 MAG: hypothetical protein A2611_01885 [Candidatus Komeilibacteria bacterium RIFOXYD1_FULL_37_29]